MSAASAWPCNDLAEFASYASGSRHRERLALHLGDGVIALIAGQATREGRALLDFHSRHDDNALAAAALDAALMRHTEIDDIHRPTAVTATAIALPALLPWASEGNADRFLDAFFVGQEVAVRAARRLGGTALMAKGLWPSYLVAPIGAAAALGRLLGLSAQRMQHALAIALAQTPRAPGRTTGDRPARWLMFGQAVRAGCVSALAAADGMDGDPSLLGDAWFAAVAGSDSVQAASSGSPVVVDELSIKPYSAAKQTLCAIEAMRRVLSQGCDPAAIEAIDLYVPSAYAAMLQREPGSASRLASMVSAGWQLSLTCLRPGALNDIGRERAPDDDAIAAFAARVTVRADAGLDALYPSQWPARLEVSTAARRFAVSAAYSHGDPEAPFGAADLMNKARRFLAGDPAIVERASSFQAEADIVRELSARFGSCNPFPTTRQMETSHAYR